MVFGAPPHPPQNKQFVIVFFYYIGGPYTKIWFTMSSKVLSSPHKESLL